MQLITILEALRQGEFAPGAVLVTDDGDIFELLPAGRLEITYCDGEVEIWQCPTSAV